MNDKPNWTYGTVLRRGRSKVMFVEWDKERTKEQGSRQFIGLRLEVERGMAHYHSVGATAFYSAGGWRPTDE